MPETPTPWFVYMILGTDEHLYTGITIDMARRWHEHSSGKAGARYFRGRQPAFLCLLEEHANRSQASKREYALKHLQRRDKLTLITQSSANTEALIARFAWADIPHVNESSPLWTNL